MPILTNCSACSRQLQVPEEFLARLVKCPLCGNTFVVSENAGPGSLALPARPQSQDLAAPAQGDRETGRQGDRETRDTRQSPDRTFGEDIQPGRPAYTAAGDEYEAGRERRGLGRDGDYDDEFDVGRRPRRRRRADDYGDDYDLARRRGRGLKGLSSNYEIDIAVWFNRARDHYSAAFGPMIGYILLNVLFELPTVIPILGVLVHLALVLVLNPALHAGYAIVALAQLRGRPWTFNDFFAGFNWFGPLLANYWLMIGIGIILMLPSLFLLIISAIVAVTSRNDDIMVLAALGGMINGIVAIYPLVRLSCFSVQLIVDRDCGPIEAIRGSWELSRGHFWGLFGVGLLLILMVMAGLLACLVGALFVAPFVVLAWNAGYMIVTGGQVTEPRRPREDDYYEERRD